MLAEGYFESKKIEWANPKHAAQWISTLRTYAYPFIGDKPVSAVNIDMVQEILAPIWTSKNETASRLRGRIEVVLTYAKVLGMRSGDNPAAWTGNLKSIMASPAKVQKETSRNMPALPYEEIGGFIKQLRTHNGIAARALEFTILTAARSGETFGVTWQEIDLDAGLWIIPASRMKAGKEHRIPLLGRTLEILEEMAAIRTDDNNFVFPGSRTAGALSKKGIRTGVGLSNMSMSAVIKRMGMVGIVPHGFRSTFRDWAAETTDFPPMVCEMALAHAIKSDVEAAYRRGDLLPKRIALMKAWGDYCAKTDVAQVLQISGAAKLKKEGAQ